MGPLLIAGGAMALGGGVLSGIGAYQEGQFQKSVGKFNARQTVIDAQITEQNSQEAARRLRLAGRRLQGRQRAAIAKSGFRLEGTPLEVMAESAKNIEMDAINMRIQGQYQAAQLRTQAKFQKDLAKASGQAGLIGAIGSVLSGGAQAGSIWAGG